MRGGEREMATYDEIPMTRDPARDWMAAHAYYMRQYAGRYVAVHEDRGVIAHADSLGKLLDELDTMGVSDDVVLVTTPLPACGEAGASRIIGIPSGRSSPKAPSEPCDREGTVVDVAGGVGVAICLVPA